jgi:serine/threonine-protein phosphatase 6 regulatory ankyrin repeat subunit B
MTHWAVFAAFSQEAHPSTSEAHVGLGSEEGRVTVGSQDVLLLVASPADVNPYCLWLKAGRGCEGAESPGTPQCGVMEDLLNAIARGGEMSVVWLLDADPTLLDKADEEGQRPLTVAAKHGQLSVVKLLIQRGADTDATGGIGGTALHWAAYGGYAETVAFLLGQGAQANSRGIFSRTPLMLACEEGHLGVVRVLTDHMGGQVLEETDENGWNSLHLAAHEAHDDVVTFLLEQGAQGNSRGPHGRTPLMMACEKGHMVVVVVLVQHLGENGLHATDDEGSTALHWAAHLGHEEIVAFLLRAGARANSRGVFRTTSLMLACGGGHLDIVRVLVQHMGDQALEETNDDGLTPLHWAALGGDEETVAFLLSKGAQANSKDTAGQTPLMGACEEGHVGVIRGLLQHMGATALQETDAQGHTALHWAAMSSQEETVAFLLAQGAQANSRDLSSRTPLMLACEKGHLGVVQVLVQHMGDQGLEEADENGLTALHWAALGGHEETVAFLLSKGAPANSKDTDGQTPLMVACLEGHVGVIRGLLRHMGAAALQETDTARCTALHLAVVRSHVGTVVFLLAQGAQANSRNLSSRTPLMEASIGGHLGVVRVLVHHMGGQGLEEADAEGCTALHLAAMSNQEETVAFLLAQGAQANTRDLSSRTPLMEASAGGHLGVVRVLAQHMGGQGLEEADAEGYTALTYAAGEGQAETVGLLLAQGAQANRTDFFQRTAFMVASEDGHVDVMRVLVQHLGDQGLEETDENKFRALLWAAKGGHAETVAFLLAQGAQPNRTNHYEAPLINACREGHLDVVGLLLEYMGKEGLEHRDSMGRTALNNAAAEGHEEVVALVLSRGARIDSRDENGATPLMLASSGARMGVVQMLLHNMGGQGLEITDTSGRTALHLAARYRAFEDRLEVVRCLLLAGVDPTIRDDEGMTPRALTRVLEDEGRESCVAMFNVSTIPGMRTTT